MTADVEQLLTSLPPIGTPLESPLHCSSKGIFTVTVTAPLIVQKAARRLRREYRGALCEPPPRESDEAKLTPLAATLLGLCDLPWAWLVLYLFQKSQLRYEHN